jgi:hypothetical protein
MAKVYEERGQIRRAQLCYRYLAELLPQEGWVWHGLAWNSWLVAGADAAIPLLKKAITLAPDNLDFLFSYGWILLFAGDLTGARLVFAANLRRDTATCARLATTTWAGSRLLARSGSRRRNTFSQQAGKRMTCGRFRCFSSFAPTSWAAATARPAQIRSCPTNDSCPTYEQEFRRRLPNGKGGLRSSRRVCVELR